jgi:hypothetical protein
MEVDGATVDGTDFDGASAGIPAIGSNHPRNFPFRRLRFFPFRRLFLKRARASLGLRTTTHERRARAADGFATAARSFCVVYKMRRPGDTYIEPSSYRLQDVGPRSNEITKGEK